MPEMGPRTDIGPPTERLPLWPDGAGLDPAALDIHGSFYSALAEFE